MQANSFTVIDVASNNAPPTPTHIFDDQPAPSNYTSSTHTRKVTPAVTPMGNCAASNALVVPVGGPTYRLNWCVQEPLATDEIRVIADSVYLPPAVPRTAWTPGPLTPTPGSECYSIQATLTSGTSVLIESCLNASPTPAITPTATITKTPAAAPTRTATATRTPTTLHTPAVTPTPRNRLTVTPAATNIPTGTTTLTPTSTPTLAPPSVRDTDGDGSVDASDNCPNDFNPAQSDGKHNGIGDLCDTGTAAPLTLSRVDLKAAPNGTISVRAKLDATEWGALANALANGVTIGVIAVGLPAPEVLSFPAPRCVVSGASRITCAGPREETARFTKRRKANAFNVIISAKNRTFSPPLTVSGVQVVLSTGGLDRRDAIANCKPRSEKSATCKTGS